MNSTKCNISSVESPGTQSRGKKANQQVHLEVSIVHSSTVTSDDQERHDPTCPAPDQTTIVDRDSKGDSSKCKLGTLMLVYSPHVGVVPEVEMRSKRANDASVVGAIIDAGSMGGLPCEKKKDGLIDDHEEDQRTKPEQPVSQHGRANSEKANENGPVDDDRNVCANPLEGFGQKQHVLEWLHMTYRSASFEKAQVEVTETLKEESIRARINAERKLKRDKALLADKQIRRAEIEKERLALMTTDERKTYVQIEFGQLHKEMELLKIRCANKEGDNLKLQKDVLDAKTELEKERANRVAMEYRLIRAGLDLDEKAVGTGT